MTLAEFTRQDGVNVERYYSTALVTVRPPVATSSLFELDDYRVVLCGTLVPHRIAHFTLKQKRAKRRPRIEPNVGAYEVAQ